MTSNQTTIKENNEAFIRNKATIQRNLKPQTPQKIVMPVEDPDRIQRTQNNNEAAQAKILIDNLLNQLSHSEEYLDLLESLIYNKEKFLDKEFPPKEISLYRNVDPKEFTYFKNLRWYRSTEIHPKCQVFVSENKSDNPKLDEIMLKTEDLRQGDQGNCYFFSAISALSERPANQLKMFVFPDVNNQRFKDYNDWMKYGAYCVKLNVNGYSTDIIIDDYFPCFKDKFPAFTRGMDQDIWMMILEKAYAKVYQGYGLIENGLMEYCLNDLTGAPVMSYKTDSENLWEKIIGAKNYSNDSITPDGEKNDWIVMGNITIDKDNIGAEEILMNAGLYENKSYTVINGFKVRDSDGYEIKLLLLRYAWGDIDWKGDWAYNSRKWTFENKKSITQKLDMKMPENGDGGLFFQDINEFKKYFTDVQICKANPYYKLSSIKVKSAPTEDRYFRFTVKSKGYYYIGVHQKSKELTNDPFYDYSYFSIIVGKVVGERVQYLEGKFDAGRNVWTNSEEMLDVGVYVVYLRYDQNEMIMQDGDTKDYCLWIYGPKDVFLRELKKENCVKFLKEVYMDKAKKSKEKWLNHAKYGYKDSMYYIENTNDGISYFYYNNKSRNLLKEEIVFNKLEYTELLMDSGDPLKASFSLKPNCEDIIILKNHNQNSTYQFQCYSSFESATDIIIDYVKKIGEAKPRLDSYKNESGVINYQAKDDEKFYYQIINNSGYDYEEFVNFTPKNCKIEVEDDTADAINFVLMPGNHKLTVLRRQDTTKGFSVGFKFKYKLYNNINQEILNN